ncbi:threonine/serine exporter family protein [Streptococcus sp. X16XC17]|nr:threonine/serine exporter family protein [Streptococcus sp. X16XC17]
MEVVVWAGELLMESGAEIYRIEDTMKIIAKRLGIQNFETYVVNQGIITSGLDADDNHLGKTYTTKDVSIHMGKLEAVNALSRQIVNGDVTDLREISQRLQEIENYPKQSVSLTLFAYFFGAGGFSMALGSSWADALASALTGLILGYVFHLISHRVHAGFIHTIIGSAVITFSASLLLRFGFGQNLGPIVLGALMILIPGAFFVNSIREFSQNNYSTGLTLLMSALLSCISLSVGVVSILEILPFVEQMGSAFTSTLNSPLELIIRTATAAIGTMAFAILYQVPRKYLLHIGILGGLSWLIYLLIVEGFQLDAVAVFVSSLIVAFCSRLLAVHKKCPMTIFLSTSIFPLIPGLSFYRAVYFILVGSNEIALEHMRTSFVTAFTIAIAIGLIQLLSVHIFRFRRQKTS